MQEIADSLKVLADPARLQILKKLMRSHKEKTVSVNELAAYLNISQPNVSHHLKVLKMAGFISCKKNQRFNYYSVEQDKVETLLREVMAAIAPP